MTKLVLKTLAVAAVALALVVGATAKTTIKTTPEGKEKPLPPPRKILVLGLFPNAENRSSFEDALTGELSLRGLNAVASFVPFPQLPKERGPFEKTIVADGYDAVSVSRFVGQSDKLEWTPGMQTYSTNYEGMGPWGAYWYTYQQVFVPGYLDAETSWRVRTDFWRTTGASGKLVWSGTTDTYEPTSVPQASHDIGVAVAKGLAKAKVI